MENINKEEIKIDEFEDVIETDVIKVDKIITEVIRPKKSKDKATKVEIPEVAKTDMDLVREYAQGKKYDLKDPQTYNAILRAIRGK